MNTTLREVLAQRAANAGSPDLDIEQLVGRGEDRLRRRRLTAVLSSVAVVAVVIALAFGLTLDDPVKRGDGPIDHPKPDAPRSQPARQLVYGEAGGLFVHTPGTIHFGDRAVGTSDSFVHIDVTDDGFVYVTRGGRVWFSDGGSPEPIGSVCGTFGKGEIPLTASGMVVSANTGSLVAWIDCSAAAELVVFDTRFDREVSRQLLETPCHSKETPKAPACGVEAVIGDHVYLNGPPVLMFDVTTGRTSAVAPQSYADELLSHPRGLIVGDTRQTGTATDGIGRVFNRVGARLVLVTRLPNYEHALTKSFDTATGHAVRLRLPAGYGGDPDESFTLFEWLDDDTVALAASGGGHGVGDILTCTLSDGQCDLALKRQGGSNGHEPPVRILPHLPLPG